MSDPKRKSRWDEIADLPDDEFVGAVEADSPAPATRTRWADIANEPDEAFAPAKSSHVIDMPVQQIEGDPRTWFEKFKAAQTLPLGLHTPEGRQLLGDEASALTGGLTAHLDQNLPFGIGDAIASDRAESAKRHPAETSAVEAYGALASPVGKVLKGAGWARSAANAALNAGGYSAARDFSDSTDADFVQRGEHALHAAEIPAAIGAAGSAVASGLEKSLGWMSDTARRFAIGGTSKQYGDIVNDMGTREGINYIDKELGRIPEQQGLTNVIIPMSKADRAVRAADRTRDVLGPEIGRRLNDAAWEAGPARPLTAELTDPALQRKLDLMGTLKARGDTLEAAADPGVTEARTALNQAARAPYRTPAEAAQLKRKFEGRAYAPGAVGGSMESETAKAQAEAADATRGSVRQWVSEAHPETNEAFLKASRDFADTKLIENMARKGAVHDYALPLAGGALGAGAGYYYTRDPEQAAKYAAGGALAGHYGADLIANAARLGERGAGALADSADPLARLGAYLDEERRRKEAEGL